MTSPAFWTSIREEQVFYYNMRDKMQLKHLSLSIKPTFSRGTLVKSA
jgi:hypothetical protein